MEHFACLACHRDSHEEEDARGRKSSSKNIAAIICKYCGVEQEVAKKCVNCQKELAKVSDTIHYR